MLPHFSSSKLFEFTCMLLSFELRLIFRFLPAIPIHRTAKVFNRIKENFSVKFIKRIWHVICIITLISFLVTKEPCVINKKIILMNFVSIVHAYVYVYFPPVIKNPRDDLLNTFAHQYSTNNTNLYVQHWSDFIFSLFVGLSWAFLQCVNHN